MPINTGYAGNIPWLIDEPPNVALARGAAIGQGIASSRLAAGQQRLQASQEERLRAVAERVAAGELSRQLGMKAAAMEIQAFQEANPNATEAQLSAVRKRALFNQAPKIFSDSPENLFRALNTDEANAIRLEAARSLDEHRRRADITDAENKALIGELRLEKIISDAQAKEMDRNVDKVRADNQAAHWKAMEKIAQDKFDFEKANPGKAYAPSEPSRRYEELLKLRQSQGLTVSKEEQDIIFNVAPRPGVTRKLSKEQYVESHLERKAADAPRKTSREQSIEDLKREYDLIYGQPASPAVPTGPGEIERFMRGEPTPASTPALRLSDEFKKSPFFKPKQ